MLMPVTLKQTFYSNPFQITQGKGPRLVTLKGTTHEMQTLEPVYFKRDGCRKAEKARTGANSPSDKRQEFIL